MNKSIRARLREMASGNVKRSNSQRLGVIEIDNSLPIIDRDFRSFRRFT